MPLGALTLLLATLVLPADTPAASDLAKGIRQVEEGDYTAAIVTLDSAASALRLRKDPAHTNELAQAYLYLGIAYVGLGHETSAKAKFREALLQSKGEMTLSPQQFPPKVIELFEVAKRERQPVAAAAAPTKGKSRKGLAIVGAGVLAAGGAAVALAAGGSEAPSDSRQVSTATGTTQQNGCFAEFRLVPTTSGTLDATATWTDAAAVAALEIRLYDYATGNRTAQSNPTSNLEARLSAPVTNHIYGLSVCQGAYPNPVSFSLTYRHP